MEKDTITAIITPLGYSSVGIIRISGDLTSKLSYLLLKKIPKNKKASYLNFYIKDKIIDKGIAIFYKKPNSFTGEDVLELNCHGNPIILNTILSYIIKFNNVRIAYPGEFSKRAFLNKKINLLQAESIIDIINSSSRKMLNVSINSMIGISSGIISNLIDYIYKIRVITEANINFFENDIDIFNKNKIYNKLTFLINKIKNIYKKSKINRNITNGIKVVIVGKTNSGKSSLFNSLTNSNLSIVTGIPGTTRDFLIKEVIIDNFLISFIDTAGIRDNIKNKVEKIGIKRTFEQIKKANYIFLVIDSSKEKSLNFLNLNFILSKKFIKKNLILVRNKIDMTGSKPKNFSLKECDVVDISAKYNYGIKILISCLLKKIKVNYRRRTESVGLYKKRQIDLLKSCLDHLVNSENQLNKYNNFELFAEEISLACNSLEELIGKRRNEDLLEKIFSEFCIGK
ncbi:MAG: tRNA uridine-5-carboxymethylaminomethyl(34) synthesis GTPase MnmE [Enterobacteriaceae bacterium]